MTDKLFYKDSYIRKFTAQVQSCTPTEGGYEILLDRTAFFPEGGGQYADTGTLNGVKISDVQEKDGVIIHIAQNALAEDSDVQGELDWEERFVKMQQHTGEHIVSGLIHARFGYENVGFHLGSVDCTMDFNGEITREELRAIEREANRAVAKNLHVIVTYPSEEELVGLTFRSKKEIQGQIRIVTIPGYDVCACCAPHVKRTGEIGLIKLTHVQRYKGGARVRMLCGFRALADYTEKEASVQKISAALCAKENDIVEAVDHLRKEYAGEKAKCADLEGRLLSYRAREIPDEEDIVCLFEENLEGDSPRRLMNLILAKDRTLCAVFSGEKNKGYRYVIGSRRIDARELAKEMNQRFNGKGGGKPEMVQGTIHGNAEDIRKWIVKKARSRKV